MEARNSSNYSSREGEPLARWRLAARLREQDWVAFAIDLLIVIVGVFLGVQASNWNDARKEQRSASAYLERVADDLRSDARSLDEREIYWRTSAEVGDRALRYAEDGKLDSDPWQTLLDFYSAGQTWNYAPNEATYREMVSAGRLDLIGNADLRRELANYYVGRRAQDEALFQSVPKYRDDIRAAVPYRFQRYMLDNCQNGLRQAFRSKPCQPPNSSGDYSAELRQIAGNAQLVGELRTWMTSLRYIRAVGRQHRDLAASIASEAERQRR